MKKCLLGIIAFILGVGLVSSVSKINVNAEYDVENIDAVIDIEQDTTYNNVNFVVAATTNTNKNFNISSGTLTLNNCKITASTTNVMDMIFSVGDNAKLILKDVIFENINYNVCIVNYGVVEIGGATKFVENRTSIENNNSNAEAIKYYSGNLENVILNSGYISVYENTVIEDNINISITTFKDMTLAVKGVGESVFANKYLDKFKYVDNSSTASDNDYYFDYIGDYDTSSVSITDASGKITLQSGDIVLTTMNMSFTDKNSYETVTYAPMYCTSDSYIKSEFERVSQDDETPMSLYYSNGLGRCLDNYSANTNTSAKFSTLSTDGNLISLNVNCIVREGSDITLSSNRFSYLSGSNIAIFIDIPEGYEFDSEDADNVEFLRAGNKTDIVRLSKTFYANSYYMRPIIEYNGSDYSSYTITVNFILRKKIAYANVSIVPNYSVAIQYEDNMRIGNNYDFLLTCAEDEVISEVKFNGEIVDFEKSESAYTFNAVTLENNTVEVKIKHILEITPKLNNLTFEYGDVIELEEIYFVNKTRESIVIEYLASETSVNSHKITKVKSCSSDDYIINIVGDIEYTITQKKIDLTKIETKTYSVQYSNNMDITYDKFLVNSLPSYLTPTLEKRSDYEKGTQTLRLYFTVNDTNYLITNSHNYISVTLDIIPSDVELDNVTFENKSCEYTGSKIEIFVTGHDESIVKVDYEYYHKDDLSADIKEAINVGEYVVKAVFSSYSELYNVNGSKTATLTITPQKIVMTEYLQSIELTEFTYDGKNKNIDSIEEDLPSGVTIVSKICEDGVDEHINAGIYYYNVNFDTVSDNYSCVDNYRVALVINPKIVIISLATSVFDYTGKAANLVVNISDIIDGDVVSPIFETTPESSVGLHTIRVLRFSNSNYALESVVDLQYEIKAISVDMNGVEFKNISTTYDGQRHKPVLTGTLPLGITYIIDDTYECINAGTYNIKCTFVSSDEGINAPSPIYSVVTIAKRELLVVYTEPSNMVANGEKKSISVDIIGIVDNDNVPYELTYSNEPILAGEYSCRVKLLDETNYVLKSEEPYRFIIFMSSINYNEEGISLNVVGKFSSKDNLIVSKINNKVEIVNLLSKLNVKDYLALNLSCVSFSSELMTINMDSKDLADELKYFKAYRVKDNKLEEIDYTISGNIISFKSSCNEEIILVEEHNFVYLHKIEINIIVATAIVCLLLTLVISINNVNSKRKFLKKNMKNF